MTKGAHRRVRAEGSLDGSTPDIIDAAIRNDLDMAKAALKEMPGSVNMIRDGVTAMHVAVGRGNHSMVKFLLQQPGIDVSVRDEAGHDCIDLAIRVGHPAVKDVLFRFRARQLGLLPEGVRYIPKTDGPS